MIERFIRGLAVGSFLGAIFAGWAIARRSRRDPGHPAPDDRQSV